MLLLINQSPRDRPGNVFLHKQPCEDLLPLKCNLAATAVLCGRRPRPSPDLRAWGPSLSSWPLAPFSVCSVYIGLGRSNVRRRRWRSGQLTGHGLHVPAGVSGVDKARGLLPLGTMPRAPHRAASTGTQQCPHGAQATGLPGEGVWALVSRRSQGLPRSPSPLGLDGRGSGRSYYSPRECRSL